MTILTAAVCAMTMGVPAPQADARSDAAKAQAQKVAKATLESDFATIADLTHAKVAELAGGREKMIEVMEKAFAQMKKQGVVIKSVELGKPGPVVATGDEALCYCVIPQTTVVELPQATVTARSYVLGESSDKGKSWTFVDGGPGAERVRAMFPKLPEGVELPKDAQPEVTPKAADQPADK